MGGRGTTSFSRVGTSERTMRRRRAEARAAGGGGGGAAESVTAAEKPEPRRVRSGDPLSYFTGAAPTDKEAAQRVEQFVRAGFESGMGRVWAEKVFKNLGYDQLPESVRLSDIRRDIQRGAPRLLRAVSGDDAVMVREFADQFISGASPYISGGMHGTGIAYTASGADARRLVEGFVRTRNSRGFGVSADLRMTLKQSAKVVSQPEVRRLMTRELESVREAEQLLRIRTATSTDLRALQRDRKVIEFRRAVLNDMGVFAAMRGYDAIYVPDKIVGGTYGEETPYRASEFLILNRRAVRVSSDYRARFGSSPREIMRTPSIAEANRQERQFQRAVRRRRRKNAS